jgi:threonine synthase
VTDEEILDAKATIDAAGIGCEPASAASLAGVRKLVASGEISPDATVVGVLTGNVLKDTDAIVAYHLQDHEGAPRPRANRPVQVEANLDALKRVLDNAVLG